MLSASSVFAFVFVYYLCFPYPGFAGESVLKLIEIGFVLLPLLMFFLLSITHGWRIKKSIVFWLLLTTLCFQIISLVYYQPTSGIVTNALDLGKLFSFLLCFLLGLKFSSLNIKVDFNRVVGFVFFCSAIIALGQLIFNGPFYYLYSGRSIDLIDREFSFRIIGTIGNPSFFAILNVFFFFYFFTCYLVSKNMKSLIAATLSVVFIFLSQSRTILGVYIILFLFFIIISMRFKWIDRKTKWQLRKFIILFSVLFSILTFYLIQSEVFSYLVSGIKTVYEKGLLKQNSFSTRFSIWQDYLSLISERPMLGYSANKGFYQYSFADNNYIYILYKYGIVGLVGYISSIVIIQAKLYRIITKSSQPIAVSTFFLGFSLMLSSLTAETIEGIRITPVYFMLSAFIISTNLKKTNI